MAVQAQHHPSNLLFNSISEQEQLLMDGATTPMAANTPALFFSPNGGVPNRHKKRPREAPAAAAPPLVSTGLHLSSSASPPEELTGRLKDEMDQFLLAQSEELRRALAERRERHYRALLAAAEEAAGRRLREKEAEVERAARRGAELEERLARLRAESVSWQAKAMAEHAAAVALHAQLQAAAAAAAARGEECGESPAAEDAESAYVDPGRAERERACRACRNRPATVVLLPCRHLCLCSGCAVAGAGAAAGGCPVCCCVRTGSLVLAAASHSGRRKRKRKEVICLD